MFECAHSDTSELHQVVSF